MADIVFLGRSEVSIRRDIDLLIVQYLLQTIDDRMFEHCKYKLGFIYLKPTMLTKRSFIIACLYSTTRMLLNMDNLFNPIRCFFSEK